MLPPALHEGRRLAGERGERVGGDVLGDAVALARGVHELAVELLAQREGHRVHDEVEPAEPFLDRRGERLEVLVLRDVAGQDERVAELRRELPHVLLEPLALVGHGQPRALAVRRLGDAPGDRALVRDPQDEAALPVQQHEPSGIEALYHQAPCRLVTPRSRRRCDERLADRPRRRARRESYCRCPSPGGWIKEPPSAPPKSAPAGQDPLDDLAHHVVRGGGAGGEADRHRALGQPALGGGLVVPADRAVADVAPWIRSAPLMW